MLCGWVHMMKQEVQSSSDEPVGIVISSGWAAETPPRFSAYMWAPGPEADVGEDVDEA